MLINFGAFEKFYQVCKLLDLTKRASSVLTEDELNLCGALLKDVAAIVRDVDTSMLKSICRKEMEVAKSSLSKIGKQQKVVVREENITDA